MSSVYFDTHVPGLNPQLCANARSFELERDFVSGIQGRTPNEDMAKELPIASFVKLAELVQSPHKP